MDEPWHALPRLHDFLLSLSPGKNNATLIGQAHIDANVSIGRGTVVHPRAVILGPAVIGENCEVRANCYVRGDLITGDHCVLGHASEFKNSILFNRAQAPHFAYVGDSILGQRAHLGAGVICSNNKLIGDPSIIIKHDGKSIDTGLRKLGAIVGDEAEIGCNSVLSPGSIIGRKSVLYPNLLWRGVCPSETIIKLLQEQLVSARRD
jgi:NDP-sugar pyrophosphorylase family protein